MVRIKYFLFEKTGTRNANHKNESLERVTNQFSIEPTQQAIMAKLWK